MKTYLQLFQDANFKAYESGEQPLTSIAVANQRFRLLPIPKTETTNGKAQFLLQRKKGLKQKIQWKPL